MFYGALASWNRKILACKNASNNFIGALSPIKLMGRHMSYAPLKFTPITERFLPWYFPDFLSIFWHFPDMTADKFPDISSLLITLWNISKTNLYRWSEGDEPIAVERLYLDNNVDRYVRSWFLAHDEQTFDIRCLDVDLSSCSRFLHLINNSNKLILRKL